MPFLLAVFFLLTAFFLVAFGLTAFLTFFSADFFCAGFLTAFFFVAFFGVVFFVAAFFLAVFFLVVFFLAGFPFLAPEPNAAPQPSEYFSFVPMRRMVILIVPLLIESELNCCVLGHCAAIQHECSCIVSVVRQRLRQVGREGSVRKCQSCLRTKSAFRRLRKPKCVSPSGPGTNGRGS